jgi:hypothetical protein
MSSCRIKRNLASGEAKPTNAVLDAEMKAKFAAMMAERAKQDVAFASVAMTDKEYEAKYGKQPEAKSDK